VRPNELRFNVITGITSRIPFLSENVWRLAIRRLGWMKEEGRALDERLKPLLKEARNPDC
jgi:hypothetical protein